MKKASHLVRWLWATPWPVYALTMLQANVIGAVFVFSFLRFALPMDTVFDSGYFRLVNQWLFIGYLALAFVVGTVASTLLLMPVFRADRRGGEFTDFERRRTLRVPFYQSILATVVWGIGAVVFAAVNVGHSGRLALVVFLSSILGAATTCLISYLQAERLLRPIAVRALAEGVPFERRVPGVRRRIFLGWGLTTVIPIDGIVLILAGQWWGLFGTDASRVLLPIGVLATAAIVAGIVGMMLVSSSIADPVRDLRAAVERVEDGDLDTRVTVYDASALGQLAHSFNEMVAGLQEREAIQDLFGRYVGEEVVVHALERGTELGGQECQVGVVFVDLVGSTEFAAKTRPADVVAFLNEFFRIVVEVVDSQGGYINKFQGDAVLAVFGAPVEVENQAGRALRAARELQRRLTGLEPLSAGIGVAYGTVIAGHIGHSRRFEYTVIGDPVNEASRLTTLAKDERGHVLASAAALRAADPIEADRWVLGRTVSLRGRGIMTQLARPLRPTLADHWQAGIAHPDAPGPGAGGDGEGGAPATDVSLEEIRGE